MRKNLFVLMACLGGALASCSDGDGAIKGLGEAMAHVEGYWAHTTPATQCRTSFHFSDPGSGNVNVSSLNNGGPVWYSVRESDEGLAIHFRHNNFSPAPNIGTNCFGGQGFDALIDGVELAIEIREPNRMRVTFKDGHVTTFKK